MRVGADEYGEEEDRGRKRGRAREIDEQKILEAKHGGEERRKRVSAAGTERKERKTRDDFINDDSELDEVRISFN